MKIIFSILLLTTIAGAKTREHGKHQHGHAQVTIAFDDTVGKLELEVPAESIIGFEHEAKSEIQKKQVADALLKLESQMPQMVIFAEANRCQMAKNTIELKADEKDKNHSGAAVHSEVQASFNLNCEKSINGSQIKFYFQKSFPGLKNIEVTVLSGEVQKSAKIKKDGASLEVK